MKVISVLLLVFISLTICDNSDNSGIKAAITSNFIKILTKFDLNSLLVGKTLIDYAETSGTYLFNYEIICENLFLTKIVQPNKVDIEQETTADGLPQVRVVLYNVQASIQIEYLYVKYGLIKETFDNPTGSLVASRIEGRYHFTNEGKLVITDTHVEIESLDIDVKSDFLNWLIDLFKGLITDKVSDELDDIGGTISDAINEWVDGDFSLDIGYGIELNLTNTLKPHLTQVLKNRKLNEYGLRLAKFLFSKEILSETLTSVLTFGIHGSCFPTSHPELVIDIPPAANMDFIQDYLTNEVQVLISTYTLNTLLFVARYNDVLNYEFTNSSHPIFPWNFDTEGLQEIIPQYGEKYPDQNLEVVMKGYISNNHLRPYVEMSESGGKVFANFNLDFFTGEVEDLSLNVTVELPFTIKVSYDLLTINWGTFNILELDDSVNQLNVPRDELLSILKTMLDTHLIKFLKGYTKNVALASILTLLTGMEFKNFKLETKDGYLLTSIAVNLDK